MITIIDYGMGNIGSIVNILRYINIPSQVTNQPKDISGASRLILPGVGSFDAAMNRIDQLGIRQILDEKVLFEKIPILGICLGMQLITQSSEEGTREGLSWINASTLRFPNNINIKVPHMGWNLVTPSKSSALTSNLVSDTRFYFVHSYYVKSMP